MQIHVGKALCTVNYDPVSHSPLPNITEIYFLLFVCVCVVNTLDGLTLVNCIVDP